MIRQDSVMGSSLTDSVRGGKMCCRRRSGMEAADDRRGENLQRDAVFTV